MAITLDGTNGINSSGVIVAPDGSASAPAITNDGDTNTGIFFPAADTIAFAEGGAEAMRIDSSSNLLINTTSQITSGSNGLQMLTGAIVMRNGAATAGRRRVIFVDSGNNWTFYDQDNQGVYLANNGTSWVGNSDERLKTDLKPIENATNKVSTLRAVTGRFLTDAENVSRSFLIAQDVQAVFPEAVHVKDDEIGTLGLQYTDIIPLLVASIKELKAINDAQASRIETLEAKVAALEAQS